MKQEKIKYTEDELAQIFFEQVVNQIKDKMTEMLKDITEVNSEINERKLFNESEDLDEQLPNIGITLNNKIVEIYQKFKEKGEQIFYEYNEERGISFSGILPAFIIENLINNYISPLSEKMVEYLTMAKVMKKIKETNEEEMNQKGLIGRTIMLIKAMRDPNNSLYFEEQELETLRGYLEEYKKINQDIYKYNIQDNLIDAILKHFERTEQSQEEIKEKIDRDIAPELIKLGMADKIQELKSQIEKNLKENKKKSWELSRSEKQNLNAEKEEAEEYIIECEEKER